MVGRCCPRGEIRAIAETPRRVVVLDVDRHGLAGAPAFREDLLDQQPADAAAAELRQQRDVGNPDVLLAAIDVEAADGPMLSSITRNSQSG